MLGKDLEGAPVDIDLARLIGGHVGILGNTGSGKSQTIRKLLELTHGKLVHIIFDVEDDFHTLQQRFPDYRITAKARISDAARMARSVIESGTSVIIELNDLTLRDQEAFIATFLNAMMALPRSLWRPALVVIDEAHRYAPQSGGSRALKAISGLLARGRKRGFTAVLATQRVAKINKNVLGEVTNWLIGRTSPMDRRRSADMLGFTGTSKEARALVDLQPGQFWLYGPALAPKPHLALIDPPVSRHIGTAGKREEPDVQPKRGGGWMGWIITLLILLTAYLYATSHLLEAGLLLAAIVTVIIPLVVTRDRRATAAS